MYVWMTCSYIFVYTYKFKFKCSFQLLHISPDLSRFATLLHPLLHYYCTHYSIINSTVIHHTRYYCTHYCHPHDLLLQVETSSKGNIHLNTYLCMHVYALHTHSNVHCTVVIHITDIYDDLPHYWIIHITILLVYTWLHHARYGHPEYTLLLYASLTSLTTCHITPSYTLLLYTHSCITVIRITPSYTLWSSRIYITALCITDISHDLPHYCFIHIPALLLYTLLHHTRYGHLQYTHNCSINASLTSLSTCHITPSFTLLLYAHSCVTVIHITPSYTLWLSTIHTLLLKKIHHLRLSRFATAGRNILKRKYTFEYVFMHVCVYIAHTSANVTYPAVIHITDIFHDLLPQVEKSSKEGRKNKDGKEQFITSDGYDQDGNFVG